MLHEIKNIELRELSKIENFDRITLLVCKNNKLIDLQKILRFKNNNDNFLSLEYSSSEVNKKLLSICEKYEKQSNNSTLDFTFIEEDNADQIHERIIPNYSLEKLAEIEKLAVRSYNACRYYKLLTLSDLLYYYKENGHFLSVRNCGKKSNDELINICKKYSTFQIGPSVSSDYESEVTNNDILNHSLLQLASEEKLSVRVQNVCEDNGLYNLSHILDYYAKYFDFKQLRNCGSNSNEELIVLCEKYKNLLPPSTSEINQKSEFTNPLIIKIEELTAKQKKIVNNYIETIFNELSVRSRNVLNSYLGYDISIKGLRIILESESFKFSNLRNAGKQTISEIQNFLNEIKENIELISLFEDENELIIELFNSFLKRKFNISSAIFSEIGTGYDYSKGLPIFKTLNVLIENELLFNNREKEIIKNGFNYFNNTQTKFLEEIALNLKITRERTRQIRKIIFDNLNSTFSFLKNIELDAYNFYGIDINSDLILIEEELITEINVKENNFFNNLFINKILSILLSETTELIGNEENIVFTKNINSTHNWISYYLVKKELTACFDFVQFIEDVNHRLSQRIEEDYSFHFETYLQDFKKKEIKELSNRITTCAEQILFNEFVISLNIEENIVFKRNTKKQVIEYVVDILEENNEPMTIYEIYEKIRITSPEISKSAEALRGTCQREARLIYFGRSSTYGLKEWEDELNIKGGTIRDIAEEFLMEQPEPKHIDKITDFVNKYRDTNAKNIYANLKMEENNRFVFFKGLMVGLRSKKYNDSNLIKTENVQVERETWAERFNQLKTFAQNYSRLPNSSGIELEQQLYRFMNVQLNKVEKGKIEQDKALLIKELVTKYNYKKRKRISQKMNEVLFDVLEKFLVENERLPRANYENEKRLYHFLFRQNKQFKNGSLNGEHLVKYLKIKNLLKNII